MYASAVDLGKRLKRVYNELYGDDNGAVDTGLASDDLAAASAEIDGYLAARYTVPVTAGASLSILRTLCLDLASGLAWTHGPGTDTPKDVTRRADDARKRLKEYSEGALRLPDAQENASGTGACVIVKTADPVFTPETLKGW